VANEKTHRSAQAATHDKLSSYGLDEIRYWIYVSHEKFDVSKFRAALGAGSETYCNAFFASADATVDYTLRVAIWDEKPEVTIQLRYSTASSDGNRKKAQRTAPRLEEFGTWFGQFFKYESTQAHMHGHFSYPLASRTSKFPLPLKMNIEDAEIDGVSLQLPSEREGVGHIRLTQGNEEWYVEVVADRRMAFKDFTPHSDVKALASVLDTFLERSK
jgi:hypothetical protein